MASTAISAQGTTLAVGTGSGAAKTISGVTLGNPTVINASTHGFSNGDVVTIAGITGTTVANGTWTVLYKTTNTFAIGLDTTGGSAYGSGGTATPTTFTAIANIKTFSGFDGSASEVDVTNLSSLAKEFRLGLTDPGQFTIELDYDNANAGHIALRAKQVSGALSSFQLTLPNTNVITFSGFVKKFSLAGGVDAVAKTSVDIRISGAITGL
jgi:hypothetical protein